MVRVCAESCFTATCILGGGKGNPAAGQPLETNFRLSNLHLFFSISSPRGCYSIRWPNRDVGPPFIEV